MLISRDGLVEWTGDTDPTRRAACLDFPVPRAGFDPWFEDYWEAMAICNGASGGPVCPVRERCLRRALKNNERFGVWGGMLHGDRKRLKDLYPNEPEMWTWQPPSVNPPKKRDQPPRVNGRVVSRRYWTQTGPPPS